MEFSGQSISRTIGLCHVYRWNASRGNNSLQCGMSQNFINLSEQNEVKYYTTQCHQMATNQSVLV